MEQVIDLVELKEKYGAEIVNELKIDITNANVSELEWKIKVIYESKNLITFALATMSYSRVYEVSKKRKVICEKYLIGSVDCEILNELMKSLDQDHCKHKAIHTIDIQGTDERITVCDECGKEL